MDKTTAVHWTIITDRAPPHTTYNTWLQPERPTYAKWRCECGHEGYATLATDASGRVVGNQTMIQLLRQRHSQHARRAAVAAATAAFTAAQDTHEPVVNENVPSFGQPTYQPIVYSIFELLDGHKFDPGDSVPDVDTIAAVLDAAAALGWKPDPEDES